MYTPKCTPMPVFSERQKSLFWGKVAIAGEEECWVWQRATTLKGYGKITMPGNKAFLAHRVAYYLYYGVDPGKQCVLHHCDRPACCNPSHHFLGSVEDNNADMRAKGRANAPRFGFEIESNQVGRDHYGAKQYISEIDVYMMREMYFSGLYTQNAIGRIFDLKYGTVWAILRGHSWKRVPMPPATNDPSNNYTRCKYR